MQNRSLILNRYHWVVKQMVFRCLYGVAGYIEKKNEQQDANKKIKDNRKSSFPLPEALLRSND